MCSCPGPDDGSGQETALSVDKLPASLFLPPPHPPNVLHSIIAPDQTHICHPERKSHPRVTVLCRLPPKTKVKAPASLRR